MDSVGQSLRPRSQRGRTAPRRRAWRHKQASSVPKDRLHIYVNRRTAPLQGAGREFFCRSRLRHGPKQAPEAAAWRQKVGEGVSLERGEERVERLPESFPEDAGRLDDAGAALFLEAFDDRQTPPGLTNKRREVDLGRVLRQPEAASFSADRLQIAELAEPEDHLNHMVPVDAVALGDLV